MKPDLAAGMKVRYWTDRPGRWHRGQVLRRVGLHQVEVQPARKDLPPVTLPLRQVQPLRAPRAQQLRRALARVLAARAARGASGGGPPRDLVLEALPEAVLQEDLPPEGVPRPRTDHVNDVVDMVVARLDGQPRAVPRPLPRIADLAYLAWVRTLPCCACGRPPRSHPHHHGPRAVGRKADDPRTVPLCWTCHRHYHRTHCLPGRTADETRLYLLEVELSLVISYRWRKEAA